MSHDGRWARDLAWSRAVAGELGSTGTVEQPTDRTLVLLARRWGSEVSTFHRLAPSGALQVRTLGPEVTSSEDHPRCAPLPAAVEPAPVGPVRTSHVVLHRARREGPPHREDVDPDATPACSLVVVVATQGGRQWFTFTRSRDFTDPEVDLAAVVQVALVALYRRHRDVPPPLRSPLTARELEVLRCVALGLTGVGAARRLGVAPATVRKHLEHVHAKLGTSGSVVTVRRAQRLGLLV